MNRCTLTLISLMLVSRTMPVLASDSQILRHIEALSRDYYYVHIEKPARPFQVQDIVGGEHENKYHILGFKGDSFIISLESAEGEAGYSLYGDGFERVREKHGDRVTVQGSQTWISIGVSATPYAEYILTVQKHEQ
ncbi:hypothetical protein BIT28_12235 [Photobacterium proteolyticum]|uniref:Uncharacterized protein n=1 Tax=Photobacterium proteolyticum TaxID=1903952 RepID=A0A1Q9GBG1_9GAMM|nr:hypothetical protein [Photobacterium proteolyticum]OLQ71675.1 hypothetical protein BIT28_12235 [Photobacterium proteolyticum]